MAGLEPLTSIIYHEKQEHGSMLCAQHALNSLLQGHYFTAPDLSAIAQNLDNLEQSYEHDNTGRTSGNMDDTGFFSVQVLENALKVWGLNLVRWRSEAMRPYQDHPHTQLAFILNLSQHWFTLRRFGQASSNMNDDPGDGHWFNLNSFVSPPEWVSKTYLGMVLQQAEAEGYSVFAVTQGDPNALLALPRTEADEVASTLPEPTSSRPNRHIIMPHTADSNPAGPSSHHPEGFDEDDYELQAALQASYQRSDEESSFTPHVIPQSTAQVPSDDADDDDPPAAPPNITRSTVELPRSGSNSPFVATPPAGTRTPVALPHVASSSSGLNLPGHADLDPVAASMERNRVALQRMREEQEFAQRELFSGEGLEPEERAALEARRAERRRQEEEEEEQLRLAIEESTRLAQQRGDEDDEDFMMADSTHFEERVSMPVSHENRVYDDDDEEIQAAIRASLETAPAGYQHPEFPTQTPSYPPPPATNVGANVFETPHDRDDAESVTSDEASVVDSSLEEPASAPQTLDEIRRARLARFGG